MVRTAPEVLEETSSSLWQRDLQPHDKPVYNIIINKGPTIIQENRTFGTH